MSRYFSAPEVDAGLDYPRLIDALSEAVRRGGEAMPVRQSRCKPRSSPDNAGLGAGQGTRREAGDRVSEERGMRSPCPFLALHAVRRQPAGRAQ